MGTHERAEMQGTSWHDKKDDAMNKKPFLVTFFYFKMSSFPMDHFHNKTVGPVLISHHSSLCQNPQWIRII